MAKSQSLKTPQRAADHPRAMREYPGEAGFRSPVVLCPPGMPDIPADPSVPVEPPEHGGWGWTTAWGWGWFPMSHGSLPPEPVEPPDGGLPPDGGQPPDGGGTPPDSGVGPPGMVLLFEDTFRDRAVNQENWWTRYIYGGPDGPGTLDYLNDEWERYRETGNHITGEGIQLMSLPHNGEFWPSGMLRSKNLFDIANGKKWRFECRAKVPRGKGIWPAFWLSADARVPGDEMSVRWPPEIDIMEIVNNGQDDTTSMLGCRCQVLDWDHNPQGYGMSEWVDGFSTQWSVWYAPFDFADDFHVFALDYQRPNITFLCDGNMVMRGTYDWVWDDRSDAPPAHVLLNLAIGGNWAGRYGIDESAFPQALEVDYVRVFCESQVDMPRNTIGVDYDIK